MAWFVSNPSLSLTLVARHLQSTTEDPTAGYTGVLFILGVFLFVCFSFSIRYFYAISNDVAIKRPGRLVKVDTQTSKVSSNLDAWKRKFIFGEGSFPFVACLVCIDSEYVKLEKRSDNFLIINCHLVGE